MSIWGSLTGGLSDLFTGDSIEDTLDPGNFFHEGSGQRQANKQWKLEYDLAKKNYDEQVRQYDQNYAQQVEAYNYQKELNALQMEREDTAVMRRVADLKASGLSPTLAAGSAAEVGALRAGTAPQHEIPQHEAPSDIKARAAMFREQMLKDKIATAVTAVGNFADVSQTFAQKKLIEAKADQQDIINKYLEDYLIGRNLGLNLNNDAQRIANEWADKLNQSEYDYRNQQITNLQRGLDYMSEQINQSKELQELMKQQRFTEIKKQVLMGLQQSKLSADISKSYLDQMATAYSLNWYRNHDLPYGSTAQNALILNALDKSFKYLDEHQDSILHGHFGVGAGDKDRGALGGLNLDNLRDENGNLKGFDDSIIGQFLKMFFNVGM